VSPVGAANTIAGSNLVGQVQSAQQLAVDVNQKNAESQAAREQEVRNRSVNNSEQNQKVKDRKRRKEEKRRRKRKMQAKAKSRDEAENGEEKKPQGYKRINVTI